MAAPAPVEDVMAVPPTQGLGPVDDIAVLTDGSIYLCNANNLERYQVWNLMSSRQHRIRVDPVKMCVKITESFSFFIMGHLAKVAGSENAFDSIYVSAATKNLLMRMITPAAYVKPGRNELVTEAIAEAPAHVVPSAIYCFNMFSHVSRSELMRTKKYPLMCRGGEIDLLMLLLPFAVFEEFENTMTDYFSNPDTGVTPSVSLGTLDADLAHYRTRAETLIAEAVDRPHGANAVNLAAGELYTIHEWKVIAYCLLICFSKSGEQGNLEQALNARARAISLALTMRLKAEFASTMLNCGDFARVSATMVEYPVLRAHLARLLLSDTTVFGKHTRDILEGSSLSMFTLILGFLSTDLPTRLHIMRPVVAEIKRFYGVKKELERKYGSGWKFHKMFFPEDQTAATVKFPGLQNAAQVWAIASGHTANAGNIMIKNRMGEAALERLRALALQPLPNAWLRGGMTREMFTELVQGCDIKINVQNITDEEWYDLLN